MGRLGTKAALKSLSALILNPKKSCNTFQLKLLDTGEKNLHSCSQYLISEKLKLKMKQLQN